MNDIKDLIIEGTARTPQVDFNHLTGELILFGKSIPENAAKVYEPLVDWINEYIKSPHHITNLRLNLEYFNSASMLWHAKMIRALAKIKEEDSVLFINLYFDNDDFENMDTGELKDIVGSLVDNIGEINISIGVKVYGTDDTGKIINESTILI
jgi:hypothetical protein